MSDQTNRDLFGQPQAEPILEIRPRSARQPELFAPRFATDAPVDRTAAPAGSLFGGELESDEDMCRDCGRAHIGPDCDEPAER